MSAFNAMVNHATSLHLSEFGPSVEESAEPQLIEEKESPQTSVDHSEEIAEVRTNPNRGIKRPKSRFKGVFKCGKKFKAQIQTHGIQHYLGLYDTEEEAARAYDTHARLVLGMKAKTNFAYDPREAAIQQAASFSLPSQTLIPDNEEKGQNKVVLMKRSYVGMKMKKKEKKGTSEETGSFPVPQIVAPGHPLLSNPTAFPPAAATALLHLNQLGVGRFVAPGSNLSLDPRYLLPQHPHVTSVSGGPQQSGSYHVISLPTEAAHHAGDWSKHPYTPLEINAPSIHHPILSMNEPDWRDQIYYWTGGLVYDEEQRCLVWEGKWMGSFTGRPPKEELESSANEFLYQSLPVEKNVAVHLSGRIKPFSGFYKGYHMIETEGEDEAVEKEKFEEKDVLVEFEEVPGSNPLVYNAYGKGDSEFGVFILHGFFFSDIGVLDMSRQYLADHDVRSTMSLMQLKQYFKRMRGKY